MSSTDDAAYQIAAQKVREARQVLANVEDTSLSDHIIALVLAVIEEVLTGKHTPAEDSDD